MDKRNNQSYIIMDIHQTAMKNHVFRLLSSSHVCTFYFMLVVPVFWFGILCCFPVIFASTAALILGDGCIFLFDWVLRKIFCDLKLKLSTTQIQTAPFVY